MAIILSGHDRDDTVRWPQSQLHPVRELYRGKVSFRFGN
jgi:hypothetical protein